jgi:hypothetical protein
MKRFLSITLAIALLLGLGSLAVLARPGGSSEPAASAAAAPAVAAQVESSQQTASQPAAPAAPKAGTSYNVIALPLNSVSQFPTGKFNAEGLATVIGPGVVQVLEWNPATGSYLSYVPGRGGDEIPLRVGGVYWLELDDTANLSVSFVGDVPAQGAVSFPLVRPTTGNCVYNDISIPLDQGTITTPDLLATSISNVEQVLQWNPITRSFLQYVPGRGGDDIVVKIGYPYLVCLQPGGKTSWPSP